MVKDGDKRSLAQPLTNHISTRKERWFYTLAPRNYPCRHNVACTISRVLTELGL